MKFIKEYKKEILFLIFISIAFCFPFFDESMYVYHDSFFHTHRIAGILDAFRDGQVIPRIYPYTNNGYGYASPLFYCDLFLYPFAILYFIGVPLVICYKLAVSFYSILSIIIVFVVSRKTFISIKTSFFCTILYTFCNYHLYDVYARSAFGEILAIAFIPIIFYAIYLTFIKHEDRWKLLGCSYALLVMSHLITFVYYCVLFGIFIVFYFIYKDNRKYIKDISITLIKAIILALMLSSWYLMPMLEQMMDQTFIANKLSIIYDLKNSILPITAILNPFAILDTSSIHIFKLANIGYPLLFLPLVCLINKRYKNKYISFIVFISYFLILSMIGLIPLYKLKILRFMQFLFRLYIVIFPLLTLACAYLFEMMSQNYRNKKLLNITLIIVSIYSMLNIGIIGTPIITATKHIISNYDTRERMYNFDKERKLRDHNSLEISGGEYLPTTEIVDYLDETTFIKELRDDGYVDLIYNFERYFSEISFEYTFEKDITIILPQTYYKGYQAYEIIDGQEIKIDTRNNPIYKKVTFDVEEGYHHYVCRYEGTHIQKVTAIISLTTFIVLLISETKNRLRYNRIE